MPADDNPVLAKIGEGIALALRVTRVRDPTALGTAGVQGFTFRIGEPVIDTVTGQQGIVHHASRRAVFSQRSRP